MENNRPNARKALIPLVLVFILINSVLLFFRARLSDMGLDVSVLMTANILLFLIFFISLWLHLRSMANSSTHVFMRNMYSGMLLKLFGGAIAAFVYIYLFREKVNKPALFGSMAIYVLYTVIELRSVLKQSKSS
ncbi:hypothetical protein [Flavihumibacter sp. UBA7668]|uniref:hypothetical protein n=1 Tax=Flavihumibacter sp. UBA7668 TaxID=1946542 RepID=UPI0025B8A811|nr:hypothetical protein [Flavihumibacter sp. UBA7668]